MSDEVLVKVEGVSKKFCRNLKRSLLYGLQDIGADIVGRNGRHDELRKGEFWAVSDVSFELGRGECFGLIGRNGAGKTTLLKLLNGLIKPDGGRIEVHGSMGAVIALGAGFNPILTGRENIYVSGSLRGMTKKEIDGKIEEIVDFAELRDFIDSPVQSYSSGMQVRLGYSVAASLKPDILLVDEVLAVGDVSFQRKCMGSMRKYVDNGGSLILVSHNMHSIQTICAKCAVLDKGEIGFFGTSTESIKHYYSLQHLSEIEQQVERESKFPTESDPVVIEGVDIRSLDGGPILTNKPMKITLRYHSLNAIENVFWGFSIWTGDLQIRIGTATSSWNSITVSLCKGRGHLVCVIPQMPLLGNSYCLKAGIYDPQSSWPIARIGWDDAAASFVVVSPATEAFNRQIISDDMIELKVEW